VSRGSRTAVALDLSTLSVLVCLPAVTCGRDLSRAAALRDLTGAAALRDLTGAATLRDLATIALRASGLRAFPAAVAVPAPVDLIVDLLGRGGVLVEGGIEHLPARCRGQRQRQRG
jgi:hypothetical protein